MRHCPVYPVDTITPYLLRASVSASAAGLPRQAGASLIEFSLLAVPLLLVGLGTVEIAHWLFTKQALSLALLEAGRAGIVQHAHPRAIATAFEYAMQPLFTANTTQAAAARLQSALNQRHLRTGAAPWQIEVLSPSAEAFLDFSQPKLHVPDASGLAAINNHYLAEQDQRFRQQGWKNGLGPQSGHSIFHANTLVLRLSWLHQPLVPGVAGLLRMLGSPTGTYSQRAMALGGYLPIKQELALVMQSHPVNWPTQADDKVTGPQGLSTNTDSTVADCTGIWCLKSPQKHTGSTGNASPPIPSNPDYIPDIDTGGSPLPSLPGGTEPPDTSLPDTDPGDPACGITLCCLN